MDKRDRQAILGEAPIRREDPRERAARDALETDLEGSPLRYRPLPRRLRGGFTPSIERFVASLGGPSPFMLRLREIERLTAAQEEAIELRRREVADETDGDRARFAREWRAVAERWRFDEVNDLIDRHNRYYPIEARLPMDPRTRDFVLVNGRRYERKPLDAAWILERFPAELDAEAAWG